MPVASNRQTNIQFQGVGFNENNSFPATENSASPARQDYTNLSSGANTITAPSGGSAVTIIPPAGNTTSITLKGISGDTGVRIHNTDPTTIAYDSSLTSFVLTAGSTINGVRLIWT